MSKSLFVVLGNQLFAPKFLEDHKDAQFFMAEDHELCTYYKFHKHKIIFFLAAMRHYADELRDAGFDLHYDSLKAEGKDETYEDKLKTMLDDGDYNKLVTFEIEDKFMAQRLEAFADDNKLDYQVLQSPMFICSRDAFAKYLDDSKKPFMKTFYEGMRKYTGMLMEEGSPTCGKFSFDSDNRKKMPKKERPPELPKAEHSDHVSDVIELCDARFADHPGKAQDFWLPVTRAKCHDWMEQFIEQRLCAFGPYQDAIHDSFDFNYHAVISPFINVGLLLPDDVSARVEAAYHDDRCDINSAEGFIRQVIGWREFVRGIYQHYSEQQDEDNFFDHSFGMKETWYTGETGIPPLDDAIKKTLRLGYAHHIERLMILSNIMLLARINPRQVHRWFMEMYVDSSDWVMGPNVYGMGQFSDGGIFATKPYVCGSNYILKMSNYSKGDWCDTLDGLYWRFIEDQRDFFEQNPRMKAMTSHLDRMDDEKRARLWQAADAFMERNTTGS